MSDTYNITAYQGSSYALSLTAKDSSGVPIDLSGYNISGLVKYKYSDTGFALDLSPSGNLPLASGVISLYIGSDQMEVMPVGRYVYDIEISSGTYCLKIIKGFFDINPEVTV